MQYSTTRFRRRAFLAGATSVALAAVAACGGGGSSGGVSSSGGGSNVLIIAMTASDIPVLDTGLAQGQGYEGLRFVGNQLYDGLTKFDLKQGTEIPKIVPGLASSWTPNATLTEWTFKLRPGVKFTDGTPWNADAAVFNIDRYTDKTSPEYYPALNGAAGLSIGGIKTVSKVDDMTIKIDTNGPWSYLPADLATVYFGSPTAIKKEGNEGFAQHPVGTGPFKFDSLVRGQRLTLVKNPDYWGGAPKLDKLILRPIPDPTARVAALRAGEVNWIEVPPPDDVPQLKSAGYQVLTNSYDHVWPWVLNTKKGPLANVKVRQALNYAINRGVLTSDILKGTADTAEQYAPHANAAYVDANNVYSYDPAKAKSLLAEAGYPNGFTMTLSFPTSGSGNMVPIPMNEDLQRDLAKVGVKVTLKPIEWAAMVSQFFAGKIPDNADAENISLSFQQEGFWSVWFGTGSAPNVGKYSNPKVDALLAKAKTVLDDKARYAIYTEVETILAQDAPWLLVVNDRNPRVLAKSVKGFVMPKSWFVDLTTTTVG